MWRCYFITSCVVHGRMKRRVILMEITRLNMPVQWVWKLHCWRHLHSYLYRFGMFVFAWQGCLQLLYRLKCPMDPPSGATLIWVGWHFYSMIRVLWETGLLSLALCDTYGGCPAAESYMPEVTRAILLKLRIQFPLWLDCMGEFGRPGTDALRYRYYHPSLHNTTSTLFD